MFDSKLNWNEHITSTEHKCKRRLNLIRAVAGNSWGASKKALLYRSLIRPVIDYVAIAYNSASECIKHRLDVIQNKALRIACGSFCSTAAAALLLQVETGEMPLVLRRSQQEIKYTVKIKATENHPTRSVDEFHWTILSNKFKPNKFTQKH